MLDGSDWEHRTTNTLHVTDDHFESFHAKVKQKWDRHLNEHEGKFMKCSEELVELLQTETTHIMKTNEQSLIQAKPILRTSSRRGDPVDD